MQRNKNGSSKQNEDVKSDEAKGMSYNEVLSKLYSLQTIKHEPILAAHTHPIGQPFNNFKCENVKTTPGIATGKRPFYPVEENLYLEVENRALPKP